MASTSSFVVSLVINAIIGLVILLAFNYLRRLSSLQWLYNTRAVDATRRHPYHKAPPSCDTKSHFEWLTTLWVTTDSTMLYSVGVDGLMYDKVLSMCCKVFGLFTLVAAIILIPLSTTSDNGQSGLDVLSLSNISDENSPRLWGYLVVAYCFFLTCMYLMYRTYHQYLQYRAEYLKHVQLKECQRGDAEVDADIVNSEQTALISDDADTAATTAINSKQHFYPYTMHAEQSTSIILRHIPMHLLHSPTVLGTYLQSIFQGHLLSVYTEKQGADELRALVDEYKQLQNRVLHTEMAYSKACQQAEAKSKPTPKVPTKFLFGKLKSVETLPYYAEEMTKLRVKIQAAQAELAEAKMLPAAVVTLNSSVQHALYLSANLHVNQQHPFHCSIVPAPQRPSDIDYASLKLSPLAIIARHYLIFAATIALVLFYSIPLTAISALSTLSNIESKLPFLSPVLNISPILTGFLEGFLPSLAFIIFQALLPKLLKFMTRQEGKYSDEQIEHGLFSKFYLFQFVNFFLITVLAGAVLNSLGQLINSPLSIASLFGKSIPVVGTQFLNYIILTTLVSNPMSLLCAGNVIVGTIKQRYLAVTPYERYQVHNGITISYGTQVPQVLLIFILGVAYACVSPIILPFAFFYFATSWAVVRYQLLYMCDSSWTAGGLAESYGSLWPLVFNRMIAALIIAEIVLIGIFGLKQSAATAILMVPLLVLTILFCLQMNRHLRPLGCALALEDAAHVDKQRSISTEPTYDVESLQLKKEVSTYQLVAMEQCGMQKEASNDLTGNDNKLDQVNGLSYEMEQLSRGETTHNSSLGQPPNKRALTYEKDELSTHDHHSPLAQLDDVRLDA